MNKRIQRLGMVIALLFSAVFVQLNNIQIRQAEALDNDPRNYRAITRAFNRPRGQIVTRDGVIIAKTDPSDGQISWQRSYPQGELYAHVTGYFSLNFGASGLEQSYNDQLVGSQRDATDLADYFADRTVVNNLTTTIDSAIQEVARAALVDATGATQRGSVVAIDPRTGALLAMYSNPTYDPNPLASHDDKIVRSAKTGLDTDPNKPTLARSYQETYAPGSTMKVVTASAAYERAPELTTKTYPVTSSITLPGTGGRQLGNFGGSSCGGKIDDLMRVSCNTGFAQMGLDMGADALVGEANDYGFDQSMPIDLPRAAQSDFPSVDELNANPPFLALSAIGQGNVRATPLQMCLVAASVANSGRIMTPYLREEIRNNNGAIVQSAVPSPWRDATSAATAGNIRELMIDVVNSGTARRVAIPGVQVAAKTGTAETGVKDRDNAWLIAFAPAEAPTVAIAVFVEQAGSDEGGSGFTGGRTAAPIAKQVLQVALERQRIQDQRNAQLVANNTTTSPNP
jgi:peptidoglycan glycosyltransferase